MKKNKFVLVIVSFVLIVLWYVAVDNFLKSNIDRNSYLILLEWEASINEKTINLDDKVKLEIKDEVKTIWDSSIAMIKWWDWSITRLWWNSVLIINESDIDKDLLKIKIWFELVKWKSWSDVISFIWEDSHFEQTFADTTAAVRWTIFEVNLENDYIYVDKHEVKLTKESWDEVIVKEKTPFIISSFSFTKLLNFIKDFQDNSFRDLNIKLDKEFYSDLLNSIWDIENITFETVNDLTELTEEKKNELYNKALAQYQKINFISTDDVENYKNKLELKKLLIDLSDSWDKENLLITTFYDFKTLAKNKQIDLMAENFSIISDNSDILKNLNIEFKDYLNFDILNNLALPEWLKTEFENNFNNIKGTLNLENLDFTPDWIINWAKDKLDSILNSGKDSLEWLKDTIDIENLKFN